ncbi:MAG: NAD(P)H-hydrate dehydratase [Rikenellaceae bacterium]|jgi:NAD(P)H-hydrate epimerase|nr:NAD(P)H-hydrate dehydratase [Rikenellaceae bacterium]
MNIRDVDRATVAALRLPTDEFAHKWLLGHALLVVGSRGMVGAALLATGGALRSGCGLVSTHLPQDERAALHARYPSAMLSLDLTTLDRYDAVGVGCGLGQTEQSVGVFSRLLENAVRPVVVDADGLNILAARPQLGAQIPRGSILTPHQGELRRLVGEWEDERQKIEASTELAALLGSVVVVKGARTMICMPDGSVCRNTTGNWGMACGGSGDVLTGFLTGLLARGYDAQSAAMLGVWLHGTAGDRAAHALSAEAMNSIDVIDHLPAAWKELAEPL